MQLSGNKIYQWVLDKVKRSPKKRKWQIKEPKHKTDPVRHEKFIQARLNNEALLIGASIRGKNHAHQGRWREDDCCFGQSGCFTIIAVADGVGSCSLSRVGSGIACRESVRSVKNYLVRHALSYVSDISDPLIASLEACLKKSVQNTIDSIEKEAKKRQTDEALLSTTLILVLYAMIGEKHLIASLQIGDGTVSIMNMEKEVVILGKADHGDYAGESRFLTSSGIKDELGDRLNIAVTDNLAYLTVMTDGVADDYFPLSKELKHFFNQMEKSVFNSTNPLNALEKWIRYEKIGSYDDRTLLLINFDS